MNSKQVNEWRIFPRLMVLTYLWLVVYSALWYMGLVAPTNGQTAYVTGIAGMLVPLKAAYFATGNNK